MKLNKWLYAAFVFGLLAEGVSAENITIDYTKPGLAVHERAFGIDATGYTNGKELPNDDVMRHQIANARFGQIRIDLMYRNSGNPESPIQCGGAGCDTKLSGDQWVSSIKQAGAEPIVIVKFSEYSVIDAANMVKHFNIQARNPVKYWIIGNESNLPDIQQISLFNQMYDAMKAVDNTIKVGGVATAYFNTDFLQKFISNCGSRADFIDFHQYAEGGTENMSEAEILGNTAKYEHNIMKLRYMIQQTVPARSDKIDIQVGEWNTNWNGSGAVANMYTEFNTVWGASVIGHILKAGGLSLQYGDKNGALGALYDTTSHNEALDTPMPVYYAHFMFTGGNLFRHFGKYMAASNTTLQDVDVFASDNSKNIVVVNKSPSTSQDASFRLNGFKSGTATIWQKNTRMTPSSPPANLGAVNISNGAFNYTIPPYSVTTFVIN